MLSMNATSPTTHLATQQAVCATATAHSTSPSAPSVAELPKRYLRSMRLLAQCYQAFEKVSGAHVRRLGVSPAEFDVIATLGNTAGMRCKELGEQTLLTKGTLSGILDRLEAKGDVQRLPCEQDGRGLVVKLTPQGETLFAEIFPAHVHYGAGFFKHYGELDFVKLELALGQLHQALLPAQHKA